MKIRLPKNNMLRFLLTVFLFVLFSQNAFAGGIGKISPQKISIGDTVTIYGSGFGPMNYLSQVCWEGVCIDSESIQSWQDTKIVFLFNTVGMPTSGRLSVVTANEEIRSDKVMVVNPYIETIWFAPYIVYANKLNILQDKVFFQPEKSMTRVETAEIIFRLLTVELLDLLSFPI